MKLERSDKNTVTDSDGVTDTDELATVCVNLNSGDINLSYQTTDLRQ